MIVGMQNSVHVSRWVSAVRGGWARIVVVPVDLESLEAGLAPWSHVSKREDLDALAPGVVGVVAPAMLDGSARHRTWDADTPAVERMPSPLHMPWHPGMTMPGELVAAIRTFHPDILHTLEVQRAGYLALAAKRRLGANMPPWLLSNWGSDLYLYERLPEHRPVLVEVMRNLDGYLAECRRDVSLAISLGLVGRAFEPLPASGGVDFGRMTSLSDVAPPSRRTTLLVKGYHGWAGRGLHILSALHLVAPAVRHLRIRILFATPPVRQMAEALAAQDGLDIEILPYAADHAEALRRIGEARVVVGMGISDGISTTLLEAMTLGAFPIQGTTSCACEWVRNGIDGILVSPHDVRGLADAIARAATDDSLVDAAASRNRRVVEERWCAARNGARAVAYYREMLASATPAWEGA
ncbi:glycosyltransferase [Methylobacterium nodulans]|nr:glycosyltransferase [Methylobacterium nodulans]